MAGVVLPHGGIGLNIHAAGGRSTKDEEGKPGLVPMLRRPPLFQLRTLAEQKALWSFPILAPLFNPPLQRGPGDLVDATARHDLKDCLPGRDWEVRRRLSLRVCEVQVSRIEGAVGQNIETVPASLSIRDRHRTPSSGHGGILA